MVHFRVLVAALLVAGCSRGPFAPGSVAQGGDCQYTRDCAPTPPGFPRCACLPTGGGPVCQYGELGTILCGGVACSGTQYCSNDAAHPMGICLDRVGAGASCATADCQAGLFCNAVNACQATHAVGQPCATDDACTAPAFCDLAAKTCAAPRNAGEPCDSLLNYSGRAECAPGLACGETLNTCMAPQPDGAACTGSAECLSDNCIQRRCGIICY